MRLRRRRRHAGGGGCFGAQGIATVRPSLWHHPPVKPAHGPPRPPTPLWRSFGHAWDGLADAAATQRNMRIHLVAGVLAGAFATVAPLPAAERALIVLCAALVIAAEAGNTALEALVDLHGGPPSEPARLAKDAAAGAVLALAGASVAVFSLVAARHAGEIVQGWRGLLPAGLAALALAGLTALLPGSPGLGRRAARVLTALGVTLITFLAFVGEGRLSGAFTMSVFAVAVAAGNRRRGRHRQ